MRVIRGLLVTAGVIAAVWVVLVVLAAVFQRQIIHLPDTSSPSTPPGVEEVTLTTDDGLELAAWFVPAEGDQVSTVLFAPGNAGNRGARLPLADGLAERGHAVLLVDHRGYGGNPGSPSEEGLITDLRAARAHLEDRADVDEERIVYVGESIGTGVVAALAVDEPPAAMVLRSPFPELADVGRAAYPFLPVRTLLRDRYPTTERLEAYDGPLLVVAGDADGIVPVRLSREVAEDADAELVVVEGAGHNDPELFIGTRFLDAVDDHVREALGDG